MHSFPHGVFVALCVLGRSFAAPEFARGGSALEPGTANHAFDHLGSVGDQAEAAVASGANIIYVSGLGAIGYEGIPPREQFAEARRNAASYIAKAKHSGIRLAIGYVCATSIVKLKDFDRNWSAELQSQLKTPAADWLQVDRSGKPLKSWYGGDYEPACMNNPDWRAYEQFIIRQQLEAGCDGIFFDNPTVHPDGCYCQHCMARFSAFVKTNSSPSLLPADSELADLRSSAVKHPDLFLHFRCTIAREFFAEMRRFARSLNHDALITANNSLNSAEVLFAQCRRYAYNIYEMSQTEDFVVVEDMSSQPRTLPSGQTIEYGPTYQQLAAISHGKPVVAVTIADSDYHTPPNLVRLAMAEAVANGGSYLSWPTWPEKERPRMISTIRPQSDFLKSHADLLTDSNPRSDVLVFLPFRQWFDSDQCLASKLAAGLSKANIPYAVICEDHLSSPRFLKAFPKTKVLLLGSRSDLLASETSIAESFFKSGRTMIEARSGADPKSSLKAGWLDQVRAALPKPSVVLEAPQTVRVVVRDQTKRTIVHLLNLNVQKLSSFTDRDVPADDLKLSIRVPLERIQSVTALSADASTTTGNLPFETKQDGSELVVQTRIPHLQISSLLVIQ